MMILMVGLLLASLTADAHAFSAHAEFECKDRVNAVFLGKYQAIAYSEFSKSVPMQVMLKKAKTAYLDSFLEVEEGETLGFEGAGRMILRNGVTGYVVQIGTGADEANASFVFDALGKLLYGRLDNESPDYVWTCEK